MADAKMIIAERLQVALAGDGTTRNVPQTLLAEQIIEALSAAGLKVVDLNTPVTSDFLEAVPLEARHQVERWGVDHDAGKTALDWFWLIGYLAQKATVSAQVGDRTKYRHHIITTGAALLNWFRQVEGEDRSMRPGIAPPATAQGEKT